MACFVFAARMMFETIDADGDGSISSHELSGFFTHRLWGKEVEAPVTVQPEPESENATAPTTGAGDV